MRIALLRGAEVVVVVGCVGKEVVGGAVDAGAVGGWGWGRFTGTVVSGTTGRLGTSGKPVFIDNASPLCICICICAGVTTVCGILCTTGV